MQEPPPAVGQAPEIMTNPQMAALVAPIDAAVLFPFYAEVNVNTAKFRWDKTGQLDDKSQSFYAVPVLLAVACCLLPVACLACCLSCLLPVLLVCLLPVTCLACCLLPVACLPWHPSTLAPSSLAALYVFDVLDLTAHILELPGGKANGREHLLPKHVQAQANPWHCQASWIVG